VPRSKKYDDGHETNRNARPGEAVVDRGVDGFPSLSSLSSIEARLNAASLRFVQLLARTDGWLRVIPAGEGKLSYFKWKFSSGEHKGKYVMYVANGADWTDGMLGIYEKIVDVDHGVRKPALDTFYDPR